MSFKPYIRCQKCRALKQRDEFPDKPSNRTGKSGICLACEPAVDPAPSAPAAVPASVRFAMCQKKRRYRSQAIALTVAIRSASRAAQMRVYQCPLCHGWHLTHKEAKAERRPA